MQSESIDLILPAASLPAEGSEVDGLSAVTDDGTSAGQILSRLTAMTQLIGDSALVLDSRSDRDDGTATMETISFSIDENAAPHVELKSEDEGDDWGTQAYSRALKRYRESNVINAGGSDCERFAESLAIAFNESDLPQDEVRRVPLLAEREGRVVFYGVWEASGADLELLAKTWSGDAASGWLPIGDDDEVEGRGLREVAFGLAACGLIATSMPGRALANSLDVPSIDIPRIDEVVAGLAQPPVEAAVPIKAKTIELEAMLDLTVFDAPNSKQMGARIDLSRLANSTRENTRIVVDIAAQRAFVIIDGLVVGDMPVSTARSGKYTPRGTFHITQKKVDKVSTIYHVALPYWMRLDQSAIGLHVGDLPGNPASAGCIRLPKEVAETLYSYVQSGTAVEVVDAWTDAPPWLLAGS